VDCHPVKVWLALVLISTLPCAASDKPVAPCYSTHGRLSFWNGTPSTRIWIIGTHRILGVHGEDQELPDNLAKILNGNFDDEVYGDFLVCPLTQYKPGEMQIVSVKKASRLVFRLRH
jgi:hypothetical protein